MTVTLANLILKPIIQTHQWIASTAAAAARPDTCSCRSQDFFVLPFETATVRSRHSHIQQIAASKPCVCVEVPLSSSPPPYHDHRSTTTTMCVSSQAVRARRRRRRSSSLHFIFTTRTVRRCKTHANIAWSYILFAIECDEVSLFLLDGLYL